jgi:hypothetical protein
MITRTRRLFAGPEDNPDVLMITEEREPGAGSAAGWHTAAG